MRLGLRLATDSVSNDTRRFIFIIDRFDNHGTTSRLKRGSDKPVMLSAYEWRCKQEPFQSQAALLYQSKQPRANLVFSRPTIATVSV